MQLSITKNFCPETIMKLFANIKYGWLDYKGNINFKVDTCFEANYRLQSPEEVLKNKVGICWDQVELERLYLKNYDEVRTYFIVYYEGVCPTHTFLTYKKEDKYYWFEHAWEIFQGIHEYESLKELLADVRTKFIEAEVIADYEPFSLVIYEYSKPKSGLDVHEFFKHCESGVMIDLEKLESKEK